MKPFRHILLATDFSPSSGAAWKRGLSLARACGARVLVVHVVPSLAEAQPLRWAYREMEAEIRADAQRRLKALVARASRAGVRAKALLLSGTPAHEAIGRAARAQKVDLIMVGTHGRTGVAGALIGSVAARIVATAPCPVLTVRGRR
jgi:nucleotide-binding universal stress UspA family protein